MPPTLNVESWLERIYNAFAGVLTAGGGSLKVNVTSTVASTVTANQGTAGSAWPVSLAAQPAMEGTTPFRNLDLDETGVQVGAAGARRLMGWYLYNNATATRYIKLYNKGSAPTNADTPALTIPLPAGAAANVQLGSGVPFSLGIGARATTGVADNDTGAPAANDVVVNLFYQ